MAAIVVKCGGTRWCETNILRNLKRKCGGIWHIISSLSEKVRGRVWIANTGLDRLSVTLFWPFATLVWVSTHTLGTTGLDKLNNRCVNCGENYFLTLEQSHGDNRLWLRFRKYLTVFTLCVVKHMQVCLENMCSFPQFTILSLSYL